MLKKLITQISLTLIKSNWPIMDSCMFFKKDDYQRVPKLRQNTMKISECFNYSETINTEG